MKSRPSICPLCSRGCNISIEYHEGFALFPNKKRVYRIKAWENSDINGYWICDYGRYGYNYIDENRLDKIVQNINGHKKVYGWDESLEFLSNQILRLVYRKRTDRITLILNSNLTNEELFLIHHLFLKELKVSNIFFADHSTGEADDFLLTEERSSNHRGALEMGYDPKPLNLQQFPEKTELLLIFASFNEEMFKSSEFSEILKHIPVKIFITTHQHELVPQMELVLPGALIPEKSGSLTNIQGLIQPFSSVFDPPGEARPEWQTLVHLARKTGINFKFFAPFSKSEDIFSKLQNEINFFRKNK